VIGALIRNAVHWTGTATDEKGNFQLSLPAGRQNLEVTYLGYRSLLLDILLYDNADIELEMAVAPVNLDEVIVEAHSDKNKVDRGEVGLEVLSSTDIRSLPAFLGEADVIRGLERLPGVSTAGEVGSGFNVRGGDVDQNLVLLDEAIIFNTSHALGFFSIFHPDAVQLASLYKGNVPAKYGGRLSSVLAVDLKTPNARKWHGNGGISIASARVYVEGPLREEKTSLSAGFRSTYSNWLLRHAQNTDVNASKVYFGDGVIKLHHRLGEKGQLSATGYLSQDDFRYSDEFGFQWTTLFGSLSWRHLFTDRLGFTMHLVNGAYRSHQLEPEADDAFRLTNGIDYQKIKSQLTYSDGAHLFTLGAEVIRYRMLPEHIRPDHGDSRILEKEIEKDRGFEGAFFLEDKWDVSERFSFTGGIRFSGYLAKGPRTVIRYAEGMPPSVESIVDSIEYGKGETIESFGRIEPRMSLSYKLDYSTSVKTSFDFHTQYLHLISNTTVAAPVDLWQLSNAHINPASGRAVSFGVFRNLKEWGNFSLELFYRWSDNLVEYRDFADLTLNPHLETELVEGQGRAYGAEILFAGCIHLFAK
jgi:hypothetical protein